MLGESCVLSGLPDNVSISRCDAPCIAVCRCSRDRIVRAATSTNANAISLTLSPRLPAIIFSNSDRAQFWYRRLLLRDCEILRAAEADNLKGEPSQLALAQKAQCSTKGEAGEGEEEEEEEYEEEEEETKKKGSHWNKMMNLLMQLRKVWTFVWTLVWIWV